MDQDWHAYLMARHHTDLVFGTVLMGVVFVSMLTGRSLVKYRGIVSRAKDPKTFWQSIALYFVLGLVFFGLYIYTLN